MKWQEAMTLQKNRMKHMPVEILSTGAQLYDCLIDL